MKFAKKMILVPAGRPEPSTQHLTELDKQMADVLKNNQLSDYEKIVKYNYILSRNKLIDSNIKESIKQNDNDQNDKLREIIRDEINKLASKSSLKNIKTEPFKTNPNDNTSHKNIKTELINASPSYSDISSYSRNSQDDIMNSTMNMSDQSDDVDMDTSQNVQQKHNKKISNKNTINLQRRNSDTIEPPKLRWNSIMNTTQPVAKRLRSSKRKRHM